MKKKLLYYTDCPIFGGCENMLVNFLQSEELAAAYDVGFWYCYSRQYQEGLHKRIPLDRLNIKVKAMRGLYCFRLAHSLRSRLLRKSVLVIEAMIFKYPLLAYNVLRLYWCLRSEEIDIVHINNGGYPAAYTCNAAVIAAKLSGVKYIVYVVNNLAVSYGNPARWLDYPVDHIIKKMVTQFITGSAFAAAQLRHVLSLPESGVLVFPNGIRLRQVTMAQQACRQHLKLDQNRVVAVVVALLEERKGHIYLLKAMQWLKSKNKILPLLLIEGTGSQKSILEAYVQTNGLAGDVLFLGTAPCVFDLINAADFVILPSIAQEDFPNVVLESMALGKAVVGTELAGIPEQIVQGKTGLLVTPKSEEELARAIEQLTSNKEKCLSMGEAGYQRFNTLFVEKVAVFRYLALYDKIQKAI